MLPAWVILCFTTRRTSWDDALGTKKRAFSDAKDLQGRNMDIGELVAVVVNVEKPEKCWFCDEEPSEGNRKSRVTKAGSSYYRGRAERNTKLSDLSWKKDDKYSGSAEAHHIIAGRAMEKIEALHEYILESKGRIREDIGYDVNHANNLMWMPGRPVPQGDSNRISAIKESGTQIHNSGHPDYRANIRELLTEIHAKIKRDKEEKKCPLCEKKIDDKERPPYGLVRRLDTLSSKIKLLLRKQPKDWLIEDGYYTFSGSVKRSVAVWIENGEL